MTRKCRFCDQELDQDHFFFCSKFCEDLFEEEYNYILDEQERIHKLKEVYKPV